MAGKVPKKPHNFCCENTRGCDGEKVLPKTLRPDHVTFLTSIM